MDKRLYRSQEKKVIAGVCGGLGDYLDIDAVIIRIIIILLTIFHGMGLLAYIILWIVIPKEISITQSTENNYGESEPTFSENASEKVNNMEDNIKTNSNSSNSKIITGVMLIVIGLVFLARKFFPILDFQLLFSIAMIVLGVLLLFKSFNKSEKLS